MLFPNLAAKSITWLSASSALSMLVFMADESSLRIASAVSCKILKRSPASVFHRSSPVTEISMFDISDNLACNALSLPE